MIWAKVKREVAERNNIFQLADVERLTNEALIGLQERIGNHVLLMWKNYKKMILKKKLQGTKSLKEWL